MAQVRTTQQQQTAKHNLSKGRFQARKHQPREPRVSYAQALLDTRNEPEYNDLGLSLGEGKELASPEDMKMKLLARQMGEKRLRAMAGKQGVDPNAFMNQGPRKSPEAPLNPQTEQGRSAQQYIDDSTPESLKPRGVGDVDPTSVSNLRSQFQNLLKRQQQTKKGSDERKEVEDVMERQRQRIQKAVKRKVEAAAKRGIIYAVDFVAGCFDLGSSGISFLIDFIFYIFTFGWLNLEMIYGRHFRKGKDLLISPISWDPIPVPVDPEAVILQGFLVMADLALLVVFGMLFLLGVCVIHDFSIFTESPYSLVMTLVTNSSDLCTGDIIKTMLGL